MGVSCFTLVAISLERYFAICRPLQSRRWQTLSHSYRTIVVTWVFAFIAMVPIAVYTKLNRLPSGNYMCTEVWDSPKWEKAYAIVIVMVLLWFPIIIMVLSYSLISHTLWQGIKQDEEMAKGVVQLYHLVSINDFMSPYITVHVVPCQLNHIDTNMTELFEQFFRHV